MRIGGILAGTCGVLAALAIPGVAQADPPFPDVNAYTAVAPDKYFVTNQNATTRSIQFTTPDGIGCMFRASEGTGPSSRQRLSCDGPIPGIPADAPAAATVPGLGAPSVPGLSNPLPGGCPIGTAAQKGDGPFSFTKGTWSCTTKPDAPLLDVGQKLTYGNVTCVVGAGSLTACQVTRDNEKHGFVLQPGGSVAF